MSNLNELTATEAARRIAAGDASAEELTRACLARIEAREPDVSAWQYLDPEQALDQARERDRGPASGLLHGVPVAFKDIVDTADMPTTYGSPIYAGHWPGADAACVALARAAGAVVLGKTVTTEYAGRYPGPTANPHDRARTPGGSSSGSAAAVADRMVPLATGSQTAGSTIRPAAYCGVYGYKPTFGLLSFSGIRHLAESFDTLGLMARSLDDVSLFRAVLLGLDAVPALPAIDAPPSIALCRTPWWDRADGATHERLEHAASRLADAGAKVTELELPEPFAATEEIAWSVIHFETARTLAGEYREHRDGLSGWMREVIEKGRSLPLARYLEHCAEIERLQREMHALLEGCDAVLTPSAPGEAPVGLADTGPPTFNVLWHALGMPAVTLPAFTGPSGLPIGAQLVSRRREDERLLAVAAWAGKRIA